MPLPMGRFPGAALLQLAENWALCPCILLRCPGCVLAGEVVLLAAVWAFFLSQRVVAAVREAGKAVGGCCRTSGNGRRPSAKAVVLLAVLLAAQ